MSTALTVVADYGQVFIYDPITIEHAEAVRVLERALGPGHPASVRARGDALLTLRDVVEELRGRGDLSGAMRITQLARQDDGRASAYMDALADATESRRFVGSAGGLIDLLTPGQYNLRTPMLVEVWELEPGDSRDEWDHEVDIDIDAPSGTLVFEAAGGSGSTTTEIMPGMYRARVSGRGFTVTGYAGADGQDSYRLQLWPRRDAAPPALRRSWPGWVDYR
jgi:hypothetical protein